MLKFGEATIVAQAENSDVLFAGSMAVAVIAYPAGTAPASFATKLALQLASVVTLFVPRKIWPSPLVESSQAGFAKNCKVKVVFALLLSVPRMPTPFAVTACVRTGKFCNMFAPVSASQLSLGVTR